VPYAEIREGSGGDVGRDVEEFYGVFYPRLVTALCSATRDRYEAEDAAQEAFARLIRTRGLDHLTAPEAWLYTVGLNVVRSRWRSVKRRREKLRVLHEARGEPDHDPLLSIQSIDLQRALQALPDAHRDALILFYLLDQPIARIADHYGVSVGTIKSRLSRGRQLLAKQLQEVDLS